MSKITPFLWFDNNAEEAMNFYVSIFNDSKIQNISRGPQGTAMGVTFELNGLKIMALNGGPHYKLNEAFSLFVNCEDQNEIDYFWQKLSKGGEEGQCGWLKDKFGLSWQIVPKQLGGLIGNPDREKANRALQAMLKMKKLVISELEDAFEGK